MPFFHEDVVDRRRRRAIRAGLVMAVLSLPYLAAIPAAFLWPGILVDEPCAERVRRETSPIGWGEARFSWFPPGWRCESTTDTGDESVSVLLPPFGGSGW